MLALPVSNFMYTYLRGESSKVPAKASMLHDRPVKACACSEILVDAQLSTEVGRAPIDRRIEDESSPVEHRQRVLSSE